MVKYFIWIIAGMLILPSMWNNIEIGGDEWMEFNKSMSLKLSPDTYCKLWNDQPNGFTKVLTFIINKDLELPYWFLARLITIIVTIGGLLVWYKILKLYSKGIAITFVSIYIMWPGTLVANISAMLEPVAIGLGWLSVGVAVLGIRRGDYKYLIMSGALIAIAVSVKLTALICLPSLFIATICSNEKEHTATIKNMLLYISVILATFTSVLCILNNVLPGSGIFGGAMHHYEASMNLSGTKEGHEFLNPLAWILPAIAAVLGIVSSERKRIQVVMLCGVFVALFVHSIYNPWWWYYELHFAWPGSLVASFGITNIVKIINRGKLNMLKSASGAMVLFAISSGLLHNLGAVGYTVNALRAAPKWKEWEDIINVIKDNGHKGDYIYTDVPYLAHATYRILPEELAVPAIKREWTEQLTAEKKEHIIMSNIPSQIVVKRIGGIVNTEQFKGWLCKNYKPTALKQGHILWVRKDIKGTVMNVGGDAHALEYIKYIKENYDRNKN